MTTPTNPPRPPVTAPDTGPAPLPGRPGAGSTRPRPGQRQLLVYTPDGPLGGTFTCLACAAQAWQPDLLDHAPGCPHRHGPAPLSTPPGPEGQ